MAIERVSRRADLIPDFLELPRRLYAADRRWIPGDATFLREALAAAVHGAPPGLAPLSEHFIGRARTVRVSARWVSSRRRTTRR